MTLAVGAAGTAIAAEALQVGYRSPSGAVTVVLQDFDLTVPEGQFLTIIGPSGCGKSTFLRAAADLIAPLSGSLRVLGGPPSEARRQRHVSFVFQDATLLPWRTVIDNILLPHDVGPRRADSDRASADELLKLMGLGQLNDRYPAQLSGGQRQRVAIARALISHPRILLMDEPFGALDEITRDRLNDELLNLWRRTRATILFVTHSIMEAAYLGERVMVLAANSGAVRSILDMRPFKGPSGECVREDPQIVEAMAALRTELARG
jgi:NitT/TauT family transport system ATP-binding protein